MTLNFIDINPIFEEEPEIYNFKVNISGFQLSRGSMIMNYNEIIDRWFFDFQLDGEFLIRGIKIVPDTPLLYKIQSLTDFGELFCYSDNSDPITRYSFLNKTAFLGHFVNDS